MTQPTDTDALIARLEAATGPDRELDAEIALATGWITFILEGFGQRWQRGHGTVETHHPNFTASIDAALTLCGGESGLGSLIAGNFTDGSPGWVARVRFPKTADGEASNPALAICITALRAKQDSSS